MEEDLIYYDRFLAGDISGFEALVLEYKNQLIYFIMKYMNDIQLAEDLAQDVFVEVYVHKERYNRKQSFKTYIFTIGRNKAVDYIRKYKREITHDPNELPSEDYYELEEQVFQKEEQKQVHSALKTLKEDYQMSIILIDLYGMSYKEAADVLKKTVPQVKILVYRARKALKAALVKEGYSYEE